ncbi:MAG: dipeptidyl peptidase 3 [Bacteroidetes bacterium]|nr:dipeptidyl peptidase 3 [Bacteroidota bacterium]
MAQKKKETKPKRIYELERVGNARTVQLYADGFEFLTRKEKIFAYYMAKAAIAGRTIAIDQTNRYALLILNLCERVLRNPKGIPAKTLKAIGEYTKLFWINNGMYDHNTARKFVPACTTAEFEKALRIAAGNKRGSLEDQTELVRTFRELRRAIFDPKYMAIVTDKTPGHDFIAQSANNFYEGATTAGIARWAAKGKEKNPLNSKVIKKNGKIEELVWRAGSDSGPAGMYARQLNDVISNLEKAKGFAASKHQAKTIDLLIRFFKTGKLSDWEEFNISWVKDSSNVDFILGFIEVYMDPRGQKAKFEAVIHFTNKEQTKLMRKLAANAQYFEERAPWRDEFKKKNVKAPIANVVNVIVETGDAGPVSAIGINLPNEQSIRQMYGSKSVLLHNVVAAYKASEPKGLLEEFCCDRTEVRRAKKYGQIADDLHTGMHEVLGHASGKVSDKLKGDPADHLPGYYSTLEEARADLVALWNVFDPKLKTLKMVDTDEIGREMYDAYVRNVFLQLRRIPTGDQLEEDHMKNRQMVVHYILRNSNSIEVVKKRGRTYFRVNDYGKMHEMVGQLLAEVMRIKAEGDLPAGRNLVDTYGLKINTAWRDEVMKRIRKLNVSSYTGFVMPDLRPVYDKKGNIADVEVEYPLDLSTQMLEYSMTAE